LALTRALGEPLTEAGADPETYRWTDPGGSWVTAEFKGGKLIHWRAWSARPRARRRSPGRA
jgi:hypothetical protein